MYDPLKDRLRVRIPAPVNYEGWATVVSYHLGELYPVFVELDGEDPDGHKFYRIRREEIVR